MTFIPKDSNFVEKVRDSFSRQPVMTLIGADLTRIEAGMVEIKLKYRADLTQQNGFLHAGITATITDSACGYAAFSLMPAETDVLTAEYKIKKLFSRFHTKIQTFRIRNSSLNSSLRTRLDYNAKFC